MTVKISGNVLRIGNKAEIVLGSYSYVMDTLKSLRLQKVITKREYQKAKKLYLKWLHKNAPVLVIGMHQTGERKSIKADAKRRALPPGKRVSKSGKIYYEYRKNRSDLKRSEKYKGWI
jgi:hypothetical protein